MLRRKPLSLPYQEEIPLLVRALAGNGAIEPPDPARFAEAALYHNVAGYALAALDDALLTLPDDHRRRIADGQARRVLHASLLRRELPSIDTALTGACGVRPLLVKGPAVADRYYPDPRLRPFSDLDLLVPRDRLACSSDALADCGYHVLEEFRPGYGQTHGHDVHVRRTVGRHALDVEIHWRLGDDPAGVPLDHARVAAAAVSPNGGMLVPATPDQLLLLAVHLLSDRQKRLDWINDIARIAGAANNDEWQLSFETARNLDLLWILHRALDYAKAHLGLARERPLAAGAPPPWGPLRAVEELDARAAPHLGRLAALGWRERASYLSAVLAPTRDGLEGTVGGDGASTIRLLVRHTGRVVTAVLPRRDGR